MLVKLFFNGIKISGLGKRAHILNRSHGICVVGGGWFKKNHEGSILTGHRSVISFTQHGSIFLHILHYGGNFYGKYIETEYGTRCIGDYVSVVGPK